VVERRARRHHGGASSKVLRVAVPRGDSM
jgi:hypothetical protein